MATVKDLGVSLSGLTFIDALLDRGPNWNYQTQGGNTIQYTFSIASGNQPGVTGQAAFSAAQQAEARAAFAYLSTLTGIRFEETVVGTDGDIHLAYRDIEDPELAGLCAWTYAYRLGAGDRLDYYAPQAWVYLDTVEGRSQTRDLAPGGYGYEILLHELGHALGLKHSFEGDPVLPKEQDNTDHTLMSYTNTGMPHSAYGECDIAALNWLYGRDGLGGALGENGTGGFYITGTSGDDKLFGFSGDDVLEGGSGSDVLFGGLGTDTAVFAAPRASYKVEATPGGIIVTNGAGQSDGLVMIERLRFADGEVALADLLGDHAAPAAPTLSLASPLSGTGHIFGGVARFSGSAEAGSVVTLWQGEAVIDIALVDSAGSYQLTSDVPDGTGLHFHVTASDSAGNTSAASADVVFSVDSTAPAVPTIGIVMPVGASQPLFSGTGEAGSTIRLTKANFGAVGAPFALGETTVGADGKWSVVGPALPKGSYEVMVYSIDQAGNNSAIAAAAKFEVGTPGARAGTAANDVFLATAGSESLDGGAGQDTVWYGGVRGSYTVAWVDDKMSGKVSVSDRQGDGGTDTLAGIERLKFADGWLALDLDGVAGQAYRLYRAAFDRPADKAGLGYWIARMEEGSSLNQVAAEFIAQKEFTALYGAAPSDADFIGMLYKNVLHRAPDVAGLDYWTGAIKQLSRAEVLAFFSEDTENRAQVVGSIEGGLAYEPWG